MCSIMEQETWERAPGKRDSRGSHRAETAQNLNARADNDYWAIEISGQTRAVLRRPLDSAAGMCDDWMKATGEPHHTTYIHTALFLESKVDSSGLTSCSHQTYLGPDRRRSSGG